MISLKPSNSNRPSRIKETITLLTILPQTPKTNHELNLEVNHLLHQNNINHLKQSSH